VGPVEGEVVGEEPVDVDAALSDQRALAAWPLLEKVSDPSRVTWRRNRSGETSSPSRPPSPTRQQVPRVAVERTA